MEQYPVPQFIESEGKITYFLTFKQFFLLVGGGFACLLLYYILPFLIFIFCAIFIIISILAIAFVKIDNASILTILLNLIGYSVGTKSYVWKKKEIPSLVVIQKAPENHAATENIQEPPLPDLQQSLTEGYSLKMQKSKLKEIRTIIETKR